MTIQKMAKNAWMASHCGSTATFIGTFDQVFGRMYSWARKMQVLAAAGV